MTDHRDRYLCPEVIIDALLSQQTRVAGDVIEIEEHLWAIHGVIPVDGDVILAEFEKPEQAKAVLERLAVIEIGIDDVRDRGLGGTDR